MFDKKQKSCVKHIHLVTDDSLYNQKTFDKIKIVLYSSSIIPPSLAKNYTSMMPLLTMPKS